MELYCENEWARDLIQSIFGVGSMCGLLVMNLVSDTKSRKLAILLCFSIIFFGLSSINFNKFSDRDWRMANLNSYSYRSPIHSRFWNLISFTIVLCLFVRLLQWQNETTGSHYRKHSMVIFAYNLQGAYQQFYLEYST